MNKLLPYFAVFIFFIVAFFVDSSNHKWKKNDVLTYDKFGYHNYLPALIIYKDITKYNYLDSIELKYNPVGGICKKYGLFPSKKDSNLCNQYPIGTAIFQLPLFLVAHQWAILTKHHPADGYSNPYQHAVVLSTLLFATLALLILVKFLQIYFTNKSIFFTILLIAFGTNFFHYATLESGLAHTYQFFLYACVLLLTAKWYKKANYTNSIFMGICIGLAIITRPIDILIILIPLSWYSKDINKWQYLRSNIKYLGLIVFTTFLACLPQMIYWKYVTGNWIYYSYSVLDYFEFDRLRVVQGLFSYRKGWFLYTPLALFAFFQLYLINKSLEFHFYKKVLWIFFIPMIYFVFSWHNWFYGWSFGCRALIGTLPLLAIPFAVFIQKLNEKFLFEKIIATLILSFFTFLNLFQAWQYNHGIIHGMLMNEAAYWQIFLKTEKPDGIDKTYELQEEIDINVGGW